MEDGQALTAEHFRMLDSYQLVVVLSNSLEVEYAGKDYEKTVFDALMKAFRRRSCVGLLHGGSKELFRAY